MTYLALAVWNSLRGQNLARLGLFLTCAVPTSTSLVGTTILIPAATAILADVAATIPNMDAEKAREYVSDVTVTDRSSSCCGSSMYEFGDSYMCTNCKEYCDAVGEDDDTDRAFSHEQLAIIAKAERETHTCAICGDNYDPKFPHAICYENK